MTVIEEISFYIRNTNSKKEKGRRNEKSEMPMHSTCDLLQAPVHVSRSYTSNLPNCDTAMFSKERLSAVFMLAFSFSFPVIIHNQYQLHDFNHTQVKNTAIVINAIAYLTIYAISLCFTH